MNSSAMMVSHAWHPDLAANVELIGPHGCWWAWDGTGLQLDNLAPQFVLEVWKSSLSKK